MSDGEVARVDPTVKSYRYLRLGMIGAVVALAAAIIIERVGVDCWQPSISGYYYTPVRAILVGSLFAIGLSLVVVKGRTDGEAVADLFAAAITNNMGALLVTGVIGLVVAALLGRAARGSAVAAMASLQQGSRWGLGGAALLVAAAAVAWATWPDFPLWAHDLAAIAMFVCLVGAVLLSAHAAAISRESTYAVLYRGIAIAMLAPAVLFLPAFAGFAHRVFVVEAIEIVLFAGFWIVQTRQFWRAPDPT